MVELTCKDAKKGLYLIDENGNMFGNYRHKPIKPAKDKDGYLKTAIFTNSGERKYVRIASLVLLTFKGEPPENMTDPTVNHIDGNILNNNVNNLEWLERSENSKVRFWKPRGLNNPSCVLNEQDVEKICYMLSKGDSNRNIAKTLGISFSTVSNIRRRKNWTHISEKYVFPKKIVIRNKVNGRFESVGSSGVK